MNSTAFYAEGKSYVRIDQKSIDSGVEEEGNIWDSI